MSDLGHNIDKFDDKVMEILTLYSQSLERSAKENDERTELRAKAKDLGLDPKALQNGLANIKASLKEREGYDESMALIKRLADDMGGANSIFAWYIAKQEAKEQEREQRAAARQKEREKADEYKPAAERKPKPSSAKPTKAGKLVTPPSVN